MQADSRNPHGRRGNEHDLDRAFLDWFDARLASTGPDVRDDDVVDYLVALALHGRASANIDVPT